MACSQPDSFRAAGEMGLGVLCFNLGGYDQMKERVDIYREGLKHANPVGSFVNDQVAALCLVHCGEDDEEARNAAAPEGVWFVNPNPPKDTDGRREDSGRVGEGATGEMGSIGVDWRSADGLQSPHRAPMALCGSCDARDGERIRSRELSRTGVARVCGEVGSVAGWQSGGEWNGSQSGHGASELGFPRPMLGKMQGKAARRAGDPSHQSEEPPPEGFGGRDPFTQADAGCPAGQVVRHHLYRQPGAVGGEAPRGHVVQPDAVLEVAYRILDLGVAAMISLQFQHLPIPVGDEAVIAVGGEEGELGTGRGLHPPDDEPHRRGVGFTLEGGIEPVSE